MITNVLLWLLLLSALGVAALLLLRRNYLAATCLFSAGLLLLAALSWVETRVLAQPGDLLAWYRLMLPLEMGLIFCFYYYTKTIFRDNSEIHKGPGFWISVLLALGLFGYGVSLPSELLIFSPDFADEGIIYLTNSGFGVYLVLMLYLVFGLVQLERTLAGLHQLQRWSIKLEVIASGLLLVSFALYFSHSLLYRSLNLNYLGGRSALLLIAVGLFCYARLAHGTSTRLSLSRGIAHRSFVLLIVGGYLIVLGLVGEGLRYLNVANATLIFYGLLLLGSLGLALLFLSERLRRKIKVILHKNFYQSKYDYRDQWQNFAARVASATTLKEMQTALLDLFSDTLACKGAALYLHDSDSGNYLLAESFNLHRDWQPIPPDDPLLDQMEEDWIVNLAESPAGLSGSRLTQMADGGVFLVVPLFFDEQLEGFLLLGEQINPDEIMTYEEYDLLRMLGQQSITAIQGLRLSEQLSDSRELAAIGKVSTFVLHDLKNQVSGLALLLDNAHNYIDDPEFQQDMLETIGNTVTNMRQLITRLKNLKEKPELNLAPVSLQSIVNQAVESAGANAQVSGEDLDLAADREEIYKVVLNLLVNAVEAGPAGAPIEISYGEDQDGAWLCVSDRGCGMSREFIDQQLFKPFTTTKKHGFGIGLYQCKQIIEAHGGDIAVSSEVGQGTTFTLRLTVAEEESE